MKLTFPSTELEDAFFEFVPQSVVDQFKQYSDTQEDNHLCDQLVVLTQNYKSFLKESSLKNVDMNRAQLISRSLNHVRNLLLAECRRIEANIDPSFQDQRINILYGVLKDIKGCIQVLLLSSKLNDLSKKKSLIQQKADSMLYSKITNSFFIQMASQCINKASSINKTPILTMAPLFSVYAMSKMADCFFSVGPTNMGMESGGENLGSGLLYTSALAITGCFSIATVMKSNYQKTIGVIHKIEHEEMRLGNLLALNK